ncbi:MAG: alpha/beta hydrolase [Acidobacteriaceae bacterium]
MRVALFSAALLLCPLLQAQQQTLPLWPGGPPEPAHVTEPEHDTTRPSDALTGGRRVARLTNIANPSLTLYPATAAPNGAAVLVFPGGGYSILAYDLEGTEVCTWLNSLGVTCVLVKYRVPETGHFPQNVEDLEDAQQAMRLTRSHAREWRLDPHRIGVLGFSAGAHLAATLCTHPAFARAGASAAPASASTDARPDFALILYPGYFTAPPALDTLDPALKPSASTPPTFLLQAEDDPVHVENVIVYFTALKQAGVPAELHIFAKGGHGYGLRPTALPITHWPTIAATWLDSIHMLTPQTLP